MSHWPPNAVKGRNCASSRVGLRASGVHGALYSFFALGFSPAIWASPGIGMRAAFICTSPWNWNTPLFICIVTTGCCCGIIGRPSGCATGGCWGCGAECGIVVVAAMVSSRNPRLRQKFGADTCECCLYTSLVLRGCFFYAGALAQRKHGLNDPVVCGVRRMVLSFFLGNDTFEDFLGKDLTT